jgi:hypothetical protein
VSQAASQASIFFEQVARERRVFAVLADGEHIILPMSHGEVVPLWSSRSRVEKIQRLHPKYKDFAVREIPLETVLGELLPSLEAEAIRIGANWSGPRLVGFDYSVADARRNLDHWIQKLNAAE